MWQPLKKGDIVEVVAPGFRVADEKLKFAVAYLESLGLQPRVPDDLFGPDVLCSQTDEIRFRHLKQALAARDSKAIWCMRGGYGAIRIIDRVAKLKKPARTKIFLGYSDCVTLHNYLNQVWKWPTLHAPHLDRMGLRTLSPEQVQEVVETIFGERHEIVHDHLQPLNKKARALKKLSGRVYGGNLTVTQSLLGTKFAKVPKQAIMIFEDIGERGYRVDRILLQLRQANYLKDTRAIVFGQFIESAEPNGDDRVPAILQRFADEMKIPVFSGLQVGHGSWQRVVPLATSAVLLGGGQGRLIIATGCSR